MRKLTRSLVLFALLAGAGVVAYKLLLNDDAKKSLKNSYSSIKNAYERVSEIASDIRGLVVGEDELPNQEATRLQWEALGF